MKILGIGLSGLVGSKIVDLLRDHYEFDDLSISTGFDITDKQSISEAIISSNATIVLHLAAKTDVDGCEKDKPLGISGDAWKINVEGTKNVINACARSGKKLIYVSTDFVFDGKKEKPYGEEDAPSPINWYGQTKYEGEKLVVSSSLSWVILRLAYPYRANFQKRDFARVLIDRLKNGEKVSLITDHIMTPTFADDLSYALEIIINKESLGIFHAVGSQFVSPFEAGVIISNIFGFDKNLLQKTTRGEFFKNRAPRPFNLALKNDKIQKLGIRMKSFEEGVLGVRKQLGL